MDKPQHSVQLQPFNAVTNHQRYGGSQDAPLFSCDVTSLSRFTFLFPAAKAATQANGYTPKPQPGPTHQVNKSPEEETDGFTNSQSGSFINILPSLLPSFVPFIPLFVYFLSSYFLSYIPSLLPSFVSSFLPIFVSFLLIFVSFLCSFFPSFMSFLSFFLCYFFPSFASFLLSFVVSCLSSCPLFLSLCPSFLLISVSSVFLIPNNMVTILINM